MSATELTDAQIAEAAFYIWEQEGKPEGKSQDHWYRAVEALKSQTTAKPRKRRSAPKKAANGTKAPAKPRARKASIAAE